MPRFDLETVQADSGTVTVTGRWHDVRGRRFMRPSLSPVGNGGNRLLADLEHKPWSPEEGEQWVAMFTWDGSLEKADALELAVAPDVIVEIPPPPADGGQGAVKSKRARAGARNGSARVAPSSGKRETAERHRALAAAIAERDAALAERDPAIRERDQALAQVARLSREVDRAREQHGGAREEAEKLATLVGEQEVRWREAQIRADRVSGERDNALKEAAVLTARMRELEAARESRNSGIDEMRRQLDSVRTELTETREALKEGNRQPDAAMPGGRHLPPLLPRQPRRLDWSASPQARIVALGAFLVVLIVVLIILVGH